jgi:nitrate reductase NapE
MESFQNFFRVSRLCSIRITSWAPLNLAGCSMSANESGLPSVPHSRREEIVAFVVLAVLIWPVIAVGVVGGYGFAVWMYQIVFGPPGPPGQ